MATFGFGGDPSKSAAGISRGVIKEASEGGLFSPFGSPRLRALRRRRALAQNEAMRRRAGASSQLYGLDPMQRRQAMVESNIGQNAALSGSLGEADFQEEMGGRDFARGLFGGELDFQRQRQLAKEQAKAQSGGAFGSLLGAALPIAASFIPGAGPFIGAGMAAAGSAGGSRSRGTYRDPRQEWY